MNKQRAIIFAALFFAVPYFLTNRFTRIEPSLLYTFPFESQIPFIPETVWIYLSDYFMPLWIISLTRNRKEIKRCVLSFMILMTIHYAIFIIYPTLYPREVISGEMQGLSIWVVRILHHLDSPLNCFPSIHVSISFLCAFTVYYLKRKYFIIVILWALLIGISTLTLKQHYFIDIAAGFLLAMPIAYGIWRKKNRDSRKNNIFILNNVLDGK